MSDYIKLSSLDEAKFSNRWRNSTKFDAYGRFIDKQGRFVRVNEPGTKYQVLLKKERYYTIPERIGRAVGWIFVSILTIGFANFSKDFKGLIGNNKKVLRFAIKTLDIRPIKSENDKITPLPKIEVQEHPSTQENTKANDEIFHN